MPAGFGKPARKPSAGRHTPTQQTCCNSAPQGPALQILAAVESGQAVVVTHRGKPIAELVPRCRVRDLLPQLSALRASLPEQPSSGVVTFRALRNEPSA